MMYDIYPLCHSLSFCETQSNFLCFSLKFQLGLPYPEEYICGDLSKIHSSPSSFRNSDATKNVQTNNSFDYKQGDELRFSTISELHEALGPVFQMKTTPLNGLEDQKTEARSVEMFEPISGSHLTNESCEGHLLEAIVAKVSNEKSISKSMEYPLNGYSESVDTVNQEGYSLVHLADGEEDNINVNFSGSNFFTSSSAILCPSSGVDPVKSSRKKARPGENHRPRPRDRQQIQDRLKELRELVPNGSKVHTHLSFPYWCFRFSCLAFSLREIICSKM